METIKTALSTYLAEIGSILSGFDSISDLLDVLLVAVIIYALIVQLRKTQSVHIIKGIFWLAVVYAVVVAARMNTSKMIFDYLINDLLLIIVIIFGTEIRQALEHMGQSRFKNIFSFSDSSGEEKVLTDAINATVRACDSMSRDKIGSLMVFQRQSNLGELERSGVTVDAKVTTEMLCSIFFPNSALHDGAIIIKDGRIIAARCIVSLKNDIVVHDKVGTRHRAALEVSRSSDAIVVVTSEETGIISVAADGVLKRGITDSELRQMLIGYLIPTPATPSTLTTKIKKLFSKRGAAHVQDTDDGSAESKRSDTDAGKTDEKNEKDEK